MEQNTHLLWLSNSNHVSNVAETDLYLAINISLSSCLFCLYHITLEDSMIHEPDLSGNGKQGLLSSNKGLRSIKAVVI